MYAEFKSRRLCNRNSNANCELAATGRPELLKAWKTEGIVSPPQSDGVRNVLIATSDE